MKEDQQAYSIGIDVGGSHISGAIIDSRTYEFLPGSSLTREMDPDQGKEAILRNWAHLLNQILTKLEDKPLEGIAFAMPGPFDYPGGIAKFKGNAKYEQLYNVTVREALKQRLQRPEAKLHFFNDATCFGTGAQIFLGSSAEKAVGLTLGTGFGSVFLVQGVPLLKGPDIPQNGSLWSLPFKESMADDYFGTRWFQKAFEQRTGQLVEGVKEMIETGHQAVQPIFDQYAQNLAEFTLPHLEQFQADQLWLGGNIARSHQYFLPQLQQLFDSRGLPTKIHIVSDTEKCNMLGASRLMELDYWSNHTPDAYF